jgi:hypothetical protein
MREDAAYWANLSDNTSPCPSIARAEKTDTTMIKGCVGAYMVELIVLNKHSFLSSLFLGTSASLGLYSTLHSAKNLRTKKERRE